MRVDDRHAADQPVGLIHRDRPHRLLAEVLRDLDDEVPRLVVDRGVRQLEGVVDRRHIAVGELDVDGGTDHLDYASDRGHGYPLSAGWKRVEDVGKLLLQFTTGGRG